MAASGREWPLCELKNVVAFGHNELWRPKAANDLFMTLIWPQKWPIWQPWIHYTISGPAVLAWFTDNYYKE